MRTPRSWNDNLPTLCVISVQAIALVIVAFLVTESQPGTGADPAPSAMDSPAASQVNLAQGPAAPSR